MTAKDLVDPIFILGILPRSGTNFLFNLLRLHPDCGVPEPIWEDYALEPSPLLLQYADAVYSWWDSADPPWEIDESFKHQLREHLGVGLISFLSARIGNRRLLTKTPCVSNLDAFFKLFPNGYMLILVRDGRDVIESAARSFGWDRDTTARRWAEAARTILEFTGTASEHDLQYLVLRYEDLYLNLDAELRKILSFVNLDMASYDFDAAHELPIYGSSKLGATENWVHWNPVARTSQFSPIGRWKGWPRQMHERFNWIAGRYLREFGYEEKRYEGRELVWRAYNRIVDGVQKYKPYERIPAPVWKSIRTVGYQLLGLDRVASQHQDDERHPQRSPLA